jgi:hypothetical protein
MCHNPIIEFSKKKNEWIEDGVETTKIESLGTNKDRIIILGVNLVKIERIGSLRT